MPAGSIRGHFKLRYRFHAQGAPPERLFAWTRPACEMDFSAFCRGPGFRSGCDRMHSCRRSLRPSSRPAWRSIQLYGSPSRAAGRAKAAAATVHPVTATAKTRTPAKSTEIHFASRARPGKKPFRRCALRMEPVSQLKMPSDAACWHAPGAFVFFSCLFHGRTRRARPRTPPRCSAGPAGLFYRSCARCAAGP